MENPIKMDDLGVPPFSEILIYLHVYSRSATVSGTLYSMPRTTSKTKYGQSELENLPPFFQYVLYPLVTLVNL